MRELSKLIFHGSSFYVMCKIMTMASNTAHRIRRDKVSFVIINPFYVMCNGARTNNSQSVYILSIPPLKYI